MIEFNPDGLRRGLAAIADHRTYSLWKLEQFPEEKKARKVPYVRSGNKLRKLTGSFDDPTLKDKLMTLKEALAARDASPGFYGIGIVFTPGCGIVGIDLDHVVQNDGGVSLTDSQECALRAVRPHAFIEKSVSGTGLHAIVLGDAPTLKANGELELFGDKNFIALTGEGGGVACEAPPETLADVYKAVHVAKKKAVNGAVSAPAVPPTINADVLGVVRSNGTENPERARSALFHLDAAEFGDYEAWRNVGWAVKDALGEAGLELFDEWSQTDPARYDAGAIARLWTSDKSPAGGITAATLFKLARDAGWKDDGPPAQPLRPNQPAAVDARPDVPHDLSAWVAPWDVSNPPPPAHPFVIGTGADGMFPAGKASVLAGPGGSMKSALMVMLGLHVAAGKEWAGHAVGTGAVLYLSLEDDADECQRRAVATTIARFDKSEHHVLQQRLQFIALPGQDSRFTVKVYGTPERTAFVDQVVAQVRVLTATSGTPVRLVVVDHARLALGGDPNESNGVTELMRALSHVGEQTGAAVVLLCHSPKSSINTKRDLEFSAADVLGSSAFVDCARFAAVMSTPTDDERKRFGLDVEAGRQHLALRVIKSNHSRADRVTWLRRTPIHGWGVAVPVAVDLVPPMKAQVAQSAGVEERVYEFIKNHTGQYSMRKLRDQYSGKDGPLRASDKELVRAIGSLREQGRVVLRAPTPVERIEFGIPHQTKEVLGVA